MKTSDIISLLNTIPEVVSIVGTKIHNTKVPTADAVTGEVDLPFLWIQYRNDIDVTCQSLGDDNQPLGKVYDVECAASTMTEAEQLRDAVYKTHQFQGSAGSAYIDLLSVLDQDDDYATRSAPSDAGAFICSLLIQSMGV